MSILDPRRRLGTRWLAMGVGALALVFAAACAAPAATPVPTAKPAATVAAATVAAATVMPTAAVATATPVAVPTKPAPTAPPKMAVSPVASPMATPRPAATPSAARVTVTLNAVGGSGVTGTAVLEPAGNQTRITITLRGFQANTRHAGHVHAGTCENQGPVETPLTTAAAGADGSATSETTITTPMNLLRDGKHYLQFHITETPPGAGVVCGNIPM